ncbi:lasso peptide biosynthesis B2 protein [Pseudomonas sp. LRF_L74]|uniref:lasso peptide biosynthesis B2 protein n=1 Tax=Pseudomonas sp. LRF_L74 TaxID=3369422 RepID=UPI003F5DCDD2
MKRSAHRLRVIEAAVFLAIVGVALRVLPFRIIARMVGGVKSGRPSGPATRDHRAAPVGRAVTAAARRLPWHPVCLPQALAASFMLRLRSIPSHLCLGVRLENGALDAHAWLTVDGPDGGVVCGAAQAPHFVPIASLSPDSKA